jgi:hypothetical protein
MGKGNGVEPILSRIQRPSDPEKSLVLYKSFNTLRWRCMSCHFYEDLAWTVHTVYWIILRSLPELYNICIWARQKACHWSGSAWSVSNIRHSQTVLGLAWAIFGAKKMPNLYLVKDTSNFSDLYLVQGTFQNCTWCNEVARLYLVQGSQKCAALGARNFLELYLVQGSCLTCT